MDFDRSAIAWTVSKGLVEYPLALTAMEERARQIRAGEASELIWLLEHPPLYTAGTSARIADLKDADRFPIFAAGRGGQYTYHGPGQRIAYVMLDVQRRFGSDVRAFVCALEHWVIDCLAEFGIAGEIRPGRVGVWVAPRNAGGVEKKIAAIGIRIRRGVSFHGISLNVAPNLAHYDGIVPCGITEHGVTSLHDLGRDASMKDVDMSLRRAFERTFGATVDDPAAFERPLSALQNGPKRD